jgi:hypothetical protein
MARYNKGWYASCRKNYRSSASPYGKDPFRQPVANTPYARYGGDTERNHAEDETNCRS